VRALALALATGLSLTPAAAAADGGLVRASEPHGRFTITVFSSPTPLRAGPIDLSVLVQARDGGAPVLDAAIAFTLRAGDAVITAPATRAAATNKLLYAALMTLPAPGRWAVEVTVDAETVRFAMDAEKAASSAWGFWPYLLAPFAAIGVFAAHQWRVLRQ